jgi:hypothetical protein
MGDRLINDNAFYLMVDHVQKTMEQDPQLSLSIEKAIASLLELGTR